MTDSHVILTQRDVTRLWREFHMKDKFGNDKIPDSANTSYPPVFSFRRCVSSYLKTCVALSALHLVHIFNKVSRRIYLEISINETFLALFSPLPRASGVERCSWSYPTSFYQTHSSRSPQRYSWTEANQAQLAKVLAQWAMKLPFPSRSRADRLRSRLGAGATSRVSSLALLSLQWPSAAELLLRITKYIFIWSRKFSPMMWQF